MNDPSSWRVSRLRISTEAGAGVNKPRERRLLETVTEQSSLKPQKERWKLAAVDAGSA